MVKRWESWYFRNALVRGNYQNANKGIARDKSFLIRFFRNLLLGEKNGLRNRMMVVNAPEKLKSVVTTPQATPQAEENTPQVEDNTPQVTPQVQGIYPQVMKTWLH